MKSMDFTYKNDIFGKSKCRNCGSDYENLDKIVKILSLTDRKGRYSSSHSETLSPNYRSGTVNSNTVNSKFHLIRSFFEIFATFLSFHV